MDLRRRFASDLAKTKLVLSETSSSLFTKCPQAVIPAPEQPCPPDEEVDSVAKYTVKEAGKYYQSRLKSTTACMQRPTGQSPLVSSLLPRSAKVQSTPLNVMPAACSTPVAACSATAVVCPAAAPACPAPVPCAGFRLSSPGSRVSCSCRDVPRAGARVSTCNCAGMSATSSVPRTGAPRAGVPAVHTTVPAGAALADKTGACCQAHLPTAIVAAAPVPGVQLPDDQGARRVTGSKAQSAGQDHRRR